MDQNLKLEMKGSTLLVIINRPDVYNALNKDTKLELAKVFQDADKNDEVKSIILTGEGKAFCTGQDLNDRAASPDNDEKKDLGETLKTEWNPLINAIRGCKKPVIGAINGVTAGAGLSVAVACDMLVSAPGTKFLSGFAKIGLCPDAGSTFTLLRALSYHKCMEFFLLNKPLKAEVLESVGMINYIDDIPMRKAMELSNQLNSLAPLSVAAIKKNLQAAAEKTYQESMDNEVEGQRILGRTADFKEGVTAFFEKRDPQFKGQ